MLGVIFIQLFNYSIIQWKFNYSIIQLFNENTIIQLFNENPIIQLFNENPIIQLLKKYQWITNTFRDNSRWAFIRSNSIAQW